MTQGYVSDVDGDDTVMTQPDCTVEFDVNRLSREQAIELGQAGSVADPWALAEATQDKSFKYDEMGTIKFHLTLEQAVMALMSIGVMDADMGDDEPDE